MIGEPIVRYAVIIPAYQPSSALVELIDALAVKRVHSIVLIDDGSGCKYRDVFARTAAFPQVHLVRHEVNRGKGAALKTGMRFALERFPSLAGVVTADADGQHHQDDIVSMTIALMKSNAGTLRLGVRAFDGHVPLRSRVGNALTRNITRLIFGRKLADTQTGLRGIPASMLSHLLRLQSNRYEFELEMLLLAHQLSIPIVEQPIRTIYEKGNSSSHFHPVMDSLKVYLVLLRSGVGSLPKLLRGRRHFHWMQRLMEYVAQHR